MISYGHIAIIIGVLVLAYGAGLGLVMAAWSDTNRWQTMTASVLLAGGAVALVLAW